MKIWLPYIKTGGGADVFVLNLERGLRALGHETISTPLSIRWQYFPWRLKLLELPDGIDFTIAGTHIAFAVAQRGTKLITVEHHCVLDPLFRKYRSHLLRTMDRLLVKSLIQRSLDAADAVVVASEYTAQTLSCVFGFRDSIRIADGVDTDFFSPPPGRTPRAGRAFRLLWVGNLTRRKGADLLPRIMRELGPGFELAYTSGLRAPRALEAEQGLIPLGRLSISDLRQAYRQADALLFPSRLEGFGLVVAEAMACGLPVIASDSSSLPELVEDGCTGRVCSTDDVGAFVGAIRELAQDKDRLGNMRDRARRIALDRFSLERMALAYEELMNDLSGRPAMDRLRASSGLAG